MEGARTKIFLLFVFVELIIAMSFRSLRFRSAHASPVQRYPSHVTHRSRNPSLEETSC